MCDSMGGGWANEEMVGPGMQLVNVWCPGNGGASIYLFDPTDPKHMLRARPVLSTERNRVVQWRRQTIDSERPRWGCRKSEQDAVRVGEPSQGAEVLVVTSIGLSADPGVCVLTRILSSDTRARVQMRKRFSVYRAWERALQHLGLSRPSWNPGLGGRGREQGKQN